MTSSSSSSRLVLGVDGGGTKTEAWLAAVDDSGAIDVLGRGKAGSSNPRAMGLDTALENLGATIDAAWRDCGRATAEVQCAVLAISGAGHKAMREQLFAWARGRRLAKDVRIEHDAEPVLAAGTPEGWGVGLIVGTGSVAIGVDRQKQRHVVGGWGYWYGDEGSAYWIGQRALAAAARAADGRAPTTRLSAAIAERLKVDDPRAVLAALERSGEVRMAIAGLAETVLSVAAAGDIVANGVVEVAADELAKLVQGAAERTRLGPSFPLALAGGVVCGSELLRQRLLAALASRSLAPQPVKLVPQPVEGCLRLARRFLQDS
jgi:N-acetylglucosamine kinase-like BadF-type ATPase